MLPYPWEMMHSIHLFTYLSMYASEPEHVCVCVCVCLSVCVRALECVCLFVYMSTCVGVCVCVHLYTQGQNTTCESWLLLFLFCFFPTMWVQVELRSPDLMSGTFTC